MIDFTLLQLPLLAARPVWGRFDHQRPAFDATHWLVLVGCLMLFAGFGLAIYRSLQQGKSDFDTDSHAKLFRELCRAHRLSLKNRRRLRRLAAARGIAEPARLFLEPKHFDEAHLPESQQPVADEIRRLRDRLFG
jgi:hypothetical protein